MLNAGRIAVTNDVPERSTDPSPNLRRVGVLLIHGIGLQRPGDTLLAAGGALHSWLRHWFAPSGGVASGVGLDGVSLATSSRDFGTSAHARLVFSDGSAREGSWLLEESFWSDAFHPPSFSDLIRWCARMVVWVPLMYLLPRWAEAWSTMEANSPHRSKVAADNPAGGATADGARNLRHDSAVAQLYMLLLQLPLLGLIGPTLVASLILIFALSIIPFKYFHSLAQSLQRILSGSIGDSYFFVTSPFVRSAILTRVEQDVRSLAARSNSLVIVAHSQGAAVAYEVLLRMSRQRTLPESPVSLVTYGPGIQRLRAIESALAYPRRWTLFGLVTYAGLAIFYTSAIWGAIGTFSIGTASVACIAVLLGLAGVLTVAVKHLHQATLVLPLAWKNLYATHDPVAGGPLGVSIHSAALDASITLEQLLMPEGDPQRVAAFEENQLAVVNRRSLLADHTAYWQAPDDFVALVADELLSRTGAPLSDDDRLWLQVGRVRRHWRCAFLAQCRAITSVAVIAACLSPGVLRSTALWLLSWDRVDDVLTLLPSWIRAVPAEIAGALALIGAGYALNTVVSACWESWDRHDLEAFFERVDFGQQRRAAALFIAGWASTLLCVGGLVVVDGRLTSAAPIMWALVLSAAVTFVALVRAAAGKGTAKHLRTLRLRRDNAKAIGAG